MAVEEVYEEPETPAVNPVDDLAARLAELAVSHADNLLSDTDYRRLRQQLFEEKAGEVETLAVPVPQSVRLPERPPSVAPSSADSVATRRRSIRSSRSLASLFRPREDKSPLTDSSQSVSAISVRTAPLQVSSAASIRSSNTNRLSGIGSHSVRARKRQSFMAAIEVDEPVTESAQDVEAEIRQLESERDRVLAGMDKLLGSRRALGAISNGSDEGDLRGRRQAINERYTETLSLKRATLRSAQLRESLLAQRPVGRR